MKTEADYERMAVASFERVRRPKQSEVYLVYDEVGLLIYVGRTSQWATRKRFHMSQAAWWPLAVRIEHRYFPTFGDAMVAEAILIRDHRPRFNADGVTR